MKRALLFEDYLFYYYNHYNHISSFAYDLEYSTDKNQK